MTLIQTIALATLVIQLPYWGYFLGYQLIKGDNQPRTNFPSDLSL